MTCPKCGSERVRRIEKDEHILSDYNHPRNPTNKLKTIKQAYNVCLDCWHRTKTY